MSRFDELRPRLDSRVTRTFGLPVAVVVVICLVPLQLPSLRSEGRPVNVLQDLPTAGRIGQDLRDTHSALARLLAMSSQGSGVSIDQKKRRVRALFDQVRAVERLIPHDTFDLDAFVARAGRQPAQLHGWVRQRTAFVPYRGTLRGARGTLMDRKGNSLDRALLLAGLLAAVDVPVRLARTELTSDQIASLRRTRVQVVAEGAEPSGATSEVLSSVGTFAKQTGADAGVLQKQLQSTVEVSTTAADNIRRRVDVQTAMLVKSLALQAPQSTPDAEAAALETASDHWWVQYQRGTDWSDLDPDLAKPGATIAPPQETMDVDALPDELRHVLHVRVIIEKWNGSAFEEQSPVSADIVASQTLGDSIRLQHQPLTWPKSLEGPASGMQQRFKSAVLNQHEWLPVLTVGDRRISEASILDTGNVNTQPGSKPDASEGVADALSGGEPPVSGVLTGEWIEYGISSPGQPTRTIRREVFDLVGPGSRAAGRGPQTLTDALRLSRALSLLSETEILPLSCQLSSEFVSHLRASRLLAVESVVTDLLDSSAQIDRLRDVPSVPGPLHDFAVARGAMSRPAGAVYLDAINVLSRHTFPVSVPDGTIGFAVAIDIVADEVASNATSRSEQFKARLEQGVLDTNLEAVLTGSAATPDTTADLFGVSESARRWVPVRTAEDLGKLAVPPDVRSRINAELQAGFAVLALTAPGPNDPIAWWRIDPQSGDTLSFGHRGWGQAIVEYKIVAASIGTFTICSVGAYVVNGQYTARDRVICAIAGLATLAGGAPAAGAKFYHIAGQFGNTPFITGGSMWAAGAVLLTVLADALGLSW